MIIIRKIINSLCKETGKRKHYINDGRNGQKPACPVIHYKDRAEYDDRSDTVTQSRKDKTPYGQIGQIPVIRLNIVR